MKTKLLTKVSVALLMSGMFFLNAQAQVVTCYDESESTVNNFWLSHFYFAKCTDYTQTGGKDISDPAWSAYIDFNGGGYIDFTKIRVSEDGDYTVRLNYGIGWAEPGVGANFNVTVNDEFTGNYTVMPRDNQDPAVPGLIDLPVTLSTDWDNEIKIQQNKDWPTILGIQLIKGSTAAVPELKNTPYKISGTNGIIRVTGLDQTKNSIEIFSLVGKQISSETISGTVYSKSMDQGAYLVKINNIPVKVIVQ